MGIFHAYDIRGIVGEELNEYIMYVIGAGLVELMSTRTDIHSPIVVGRDARETSEIFAQSFIDALIDRGIDIIDVGVCTTPYVYFAVRHLNAGGGAMITASHNPKEYNGLKIVNKDAANLSPQEEAKPLADFAQTHQLSDIAVGPGARTGKITVTNIVPEYIRYLLNYADIDEPLTIVADGGNGVAMTDFLPLAENLDVVVHPLFMDMDGTFPNHEANPSKVETLKELQKKVIATKSDFGIAFDGDADRIGFVDEKGNAIPADIIGCLIAGHLLESNPQATIVHDLLATKALDELIQQKNAKDVRTKVGRHHLTKVMTADDNAVFGVEKSGHFFFKEFYGLDNAMMTFLHVASIVSTSGKPLSQLLLPYQTYAQTPIINVTVKDRAQALHAVKEEFKDHTVDELDGVSVDSQEFRFTVRQSNTEPLVRVSLEASDEKILYDVQRRILGVLKNV